MLDVLQNVRDELQRFVEQPKRSFLLLSVRDPELAYVYQTLSMMDAEMAEHVFLTLPLPAATPDAYVSSAVAETRSQVEVARAESSTIPPSTWPQWPTICDDTNRSGSDRLRAAIEYVRMLVPNAPHNRLVAALVPPKIPDPVALARLMLDLIPDHAGPRPMWTRGVRVIMREDAAAPLLSRELRSRRNAHVLIFEPRLSPDAIADALARQASDPHTPTARRMDTLLQLAGLDYAHGRHDAALRKYDVLYSYGAHAGILEIQVLALMGAADVLRCRADVPLARERYGQALAVALELKTPILLLNALRGVGETALALKQWKDASGHLELAASLAGSLAMAEVQADLLELAGQCRYAQGELQAAEAIW